MELMHEFFVLLKDINPIVMTIAWTAILIFDGYDWLSGALHKKSCLHNNSPTCTKTQID